MAGFRGRQAHCNAFLFDIVGYFPRVRSDSFLTREGDATKESVDYLLGVFHLLDTNIYFAHMTRYGVFMLRRVTRINSAPKGTFGAGFVVCAIW